jgi:hypothetical protein
MSSCLLCPFGAFANLAGLVACKPCEAGRYSNSLGANECSRCPPATFQVESGKSNCTLVRLLFSFFLYEFEFSFLVRHDEVLLLCSSVLLLFAPSSRLVAMLQCGSGAEATAEESRACSLCSPGSFRKIDLLHLDVDPSSLQFRQNNVTFSLDGRVITLPSQCSRFRSLPSSVFCFSSVHSFRWLRYS